MSAKDSQHDSSRRRFLKGVAVGGTVAGVAGGSSALAVTQTAAPDTEARAESTPSSGYQETAHVRRFYDLARG
ncbi:MAG: twin-arginine translocation signal domain-containing protein [Spiribacter sp.]|nr:twin-arginine translocation signal domain-containing protein [Spiribacter sp.]MDR9455239.1 twin-arginine translocation signal domain-containing protein [Spiribacter sp.]